MLKASVGDRVTFATDGTPVGRRASGMCRGTYQPSDASEECYYVDVGDCALTRVPQSWVVNVIARALIVSEEDTRHHVAGPLPRANASTLLVASLGDRVFWMNPRGFRENGTVSAVFPADAIDTGWGRFGGYRVIRLLDDGATPNGETVIRREWVDAVVSPTELVPKKSTALLPPPPCVEAVQRTRVMHVCLSVRAALQWRARDLKRLFKLDGKWLSADEAHEALCDYLSVGREYLPLGEECEGFDYATGCPGHT